MVIFYFVCAACLLGDALNDIESNGIIINE
jgi:hypothetical protein